jgi:hypothetical protein
MMDPKPVKHHRAPRYTPAEADEAIGGRTAADVNRDCDLRFQKAMALAHPERAGLCETPGTEFPRQSRGT